MLDDGLTLLASNAAPLHNLLALYSICCLDLVPIIFCHVFCAACAVLLEHNQLLAAFVTGCMKPEFLTSTGPKAAFMFSHCFSNLTVCEPAEGGSQASSFTSFTEFETFLKMEGSRTVQQFASHVWQAGHRSCASIARSEENLQAQFGSAIRQMLDFCRLRSGITFKHIFQGTHVAQITVMHIDNVYWPCGQDTFICILPISSQVDRFCRDDHTL